MPLRRLAAAVLTLCLSAVASAQFTVTPRDLVGNDGKPEAYDIETPWYKARFTLAESGAATSFVYKPLNLELRAEDYYSTRGNLFRDWVRQADPDPITGSTRKIGPEVRGRQPTASFRVLRQTAEELAVEFEIPFAKVEGLDWFDKLTERRRLTFRADSPAVRVECEIANADAQEHSVLFDLYNGVGLGRVETATCIPGPEGKIVGRDRATEDSSTFIFAPELAGDWIGGVNAEGQGAAFGFDWADVDSMEISMWKTVGATHVVNMRRCPVPAGKSISFRYTFMPFAGMGALDGMRGDLAGGVLVGEKATFLNDVAQKELIPGGTVPVKVCLVSGVNRDVKLRLTCSRQEDKKVVFDDTYEVKLTATTAQARTASPPLPEPGLYVLTATAEGPGVTLRMQKGLEVGKTKLTYAATPPAGEKRGVRDSGESLGPAAMNAQFTTLDRDFRTPHIPFVRNDAAGPARAFFVTPADSTLGHIREIAQRSDIDYDCIAIGKIQTPPDELNFQDVAAFRKKLRASDTEALVTVGINWHVGLPKAVIQEIVNRVRDGMGLVVEIRSMEEQPELASALEGAKEITTPLPPCAVPVPAVKLYQLDKGRVAVVLCRWSNYRDAGEAMLGQWAALRTEADPRPVPELRWRGFEYSYAWLGQVIHWAAGRVSPVAVTSAALEKNVVRVSIANAGAPLAGTVKVTARTTRWEACATGTAKLTPAAQEAAVTLDSTPPGGPLALEATLTRDDGKVLAFATFSVTQPAAVSLALSPAPGAFQPAAKPGKCVIDVSGTLPGGRLVTTVTDYFGRLVLRDERDVTLQDGKAAVELALDSIKPLAVYHELVSTFLSGGVRVAESSADLFLIADQPIYADRFVLGVAESPERRALHIQGVLKTTRNLGFEIHTHSYDDRMLYSSGAAKCASTGLWVSPKSRFGKPGDRGTLDSKNLIMKPPFLPSADALKDFKERWMGLARKQFETGARLVQIDDERRMSGDFDFSPETLAGFREWLKTRYATIADLNATWGAQFADFAAVMPKPRAALGESPNLAPWLDHRMYMGELIGEYYMKKPAEWAAEISPLLAVGEMGIYEPSSAWPVDWSRYARCYRYTERYGNEDLLRSFGDGCRHGQWQGYGMTKISAGRRISAWASLFNGGNFAWFWAMVDNGFWNYGVCTSDQRPTAGYAVLAAEEFPDLTGGIDRLFIASKFSHDKIALAYSYPSWVADTAALGYPAKSIVEELGYEHQYVNVEDMPAGALEKGGYKLVVLRETSCLSREQAAALARFVEAGGTLLAVGQCAWRDAHGAPHAAGPVLDALLGIDTAKAQKVDLPFPTKEADRPLKMHLAFSGVALHDARALATVDNGGVTPLLTVRQAGKGRAFWLNSTLKGHQATFSGGVNAERTVTLSGPEAIRASHWRVFDDVIAQAGIAPRARLFRDGAPVFNSRTWYYETPSGRTLLVARALDEEVEGPLTLKFARKGHIYEVRDRKYLGLTDTVTDAFPRGRVKIYAILDARPATLTAQSVSPTVKPGGALSVSFTVTADGPGPDLHALRLRVLDPQGKPLPACTRTLLAPAGKATAHWPMALNDPAGKYTVEAVDVVTQLAGQTTVTLTP